MKIFLNVDTVSHPLTGIGNYAHHLAEGLRKDPAVGELACFRRAGWSSLAQLDSRPRAIPSLVKKALRGMPLAYRIRDALNAHALSRARNTSAPCVYHEPNYVLSPFDGPAVVTVSDLSYLRYPKYLPRSRATYLERNLPNSLERAHRVITLSRFIRDELVSLMGVPREKIHTIPVGVDETFHPRSAEEIAPLLARYGLGVRPYIFSLCTLEPRKNLVGLMHAYSALPASLRARFPLVIGGAPGWLSTEICRAMSRLEAEGSLLRLGYVPPEHLPSLYAGAYAFAYPSFYEGFGMPPLEAMASGVPVVAANRSAIPEVVDDAAVLVDPHDVEQITEGLRIVLEDEQRRTLLKEQGLRRARRYSWDAMVSATVDVYRSVLQLDRAEAPSARSGGVPG